MNLSFRQAKNIGIGLLLSILLTLGIFSYWTMERTVSRLSSHIENEDRMQLYADINSSLFELTDILYKFTRWEKDDLAMIPPLIKSVISKCKKLSEIDRNHSAEINHLIRNARILKMSAAAYAAELNLGYRSGSTLREMEKHFSDAAVAAIDQSERVMKKIHSESEEGNRALMLSTRKVQKVLGLIVCIGVLWGFIVAFFVSRGILRPINQLIRATSKIAGGDFEEKIPVTSSDEIGLLADSFNRMTEELNRSFAALHKESSERKRYENIVSTSSDLLSFIDKNYIYRALNRAYAEAFQKKYEDILGHSVSDVFGQELFENRIKPKIDICLNGETYQYQAWFDFPGWGKTFLDTVFHPYFGENGDVEGIVVCARNSTEYKKLEMQLVQSQKLESVGQLAAGIAHEINSPMQYVSDNTYFLKNKINRLFDVIEKHEELVEALRSGTVTDELVHEVESVRKEARLDYLKEELPDAIEQSLDMTLPLRTGPLFVLE